MINRVLRFWWVCPAMFFLCLLCIFVESLFNIAPLLTEICFYVAVLMFIAQIVCFAVLIIHRKPGEIPGQREKLLCTVVCIPLCVTAALFTYVGILFTGGIFDVFGKRHPIPEGIEWLIPLDDADNEVFLNQFKTDFVIYNAGQGGWYSYQVNLHDNLYGEIWLECYEVGENERLSPKSIKDSSLISVNPQNNGQLLPLRSFTIYEGSNGDYYAARFELWFKDTSTGESRKLLEKTYRIEGWER